MVSELQIVYLDLYLEYAHFVNIKGKGLSETIIQQNYHSKTRAQLFENLCEKIETVTKGNNDPIH